MAPPTSVDIPTPHVPARSLSIVEAAGQPGAARGERAHGRSGRPGTKGVATAARPLRRG